MTFFKKYLSFNGMKKVIYLFLFILSIFPLCAEVDISVLGAKADPIPIAIPEFGGKSYAAEITQIISQNLENSGLFHLVDKKAYIQPLYSIYQKPVLNDWQTINVQALLYGEVEELPNNRFKVSFRLWDVFSGKEMLSKALTLPQKDWRRLGHIVSDMVYERMIGEKGYFDTKIVYVASSGNPKKRIKRLAIMDQDGENHQYLTDGTTLVLTPRLSPDMTKIAYLSYDRGKPQVFLYDIKSGNNQRLGTFEGMSFAPRFSTDGKKLLMSLAVKGNSDVYLYDIESKELQRLTKENAIDTSASFSPDGKKIVFNSDRGGSQQIYIMDNDGKNPKRITFGQGSYGTPVWSPKGDYIAFTKIYQGQFYIGVIRPDGTGERIIATGFLVEGPTFSPNGRVIMFFKQNPYSFYDQGGKTGLYAIDVSGYNERFIQTPSQASDPDWSNFLK